MKRPAATLSLAFFLALALHALLPGPAGAGAGGYADRPAPSEFRGLAFGAPVADMPGLVPVPGRPETYHRLNEELTFGQAAIVSVAYYARKGMLCGVGVAVKGEANIFLVQDTLIQIYGKGQQRGDQYGWIWPDFSLVLKRSGKDAAAVYYTLERPAR